MNVLEDLMRKHPRLFRNKEPVWSYVPSGWFTLVDDLCTAITAELTASQLDAFQFRQIKAKYGTLKVVSNAGTSFVTELITAATLQSKNICADCGSVARNKIGTLTQPLCLFCLHEKMIRSVRSNHELP